MCVEPPFAGLACVFASVESHRLTGPDTGLSSYSYRMPDRVEFKYTKKPYDHNARHSLICRVREGVGHVSVSFVVVVSGAVLHDRKGP